MKWITREKVKVDRVACPWYRNDMELNEAEWIVYDGTLRLLSGDGAARPAGWSVPAVIPRRMELRRGRPDSRFSTCRTFDLTPIG